MTICKAFMLDSLRRQMAHAAMALEERRAARDLRGAAGALGEVQNLEGQLAEALRLPVEKADHAPAGFYTPGVVGGPKGRVLA